MGWLLSPLSWLLVAFVLTLLAWWWDGRWPLAAGGLLGLLSCTAMTPLVANGLTGSLERAVEIPASCATRSPDIAVVLGGGFVGRPRSSEDFSALNLESRRRVDSAVEWWRGRAGRRLVLQGGQPRPAAPNVARLMAAYAEALGVPRAQMAIEPRSTDTWENGTEARRLGLPRRIVIVTSSIHMPRAVLAYANVGFDACPRFAGDRKFPPRLPWALVPSSRALVQTEGALHEWVGLANYRWRCLRDAQPAVSRCGG